MKKSSHITTHQINHWLFSHYGFKGQLSGLVGDVDLNHKCTTSDQSFTVKINQFKSLDPLSFEADLLAHLANQNNHLIDLPLPIMNLQKKWLTEVENDEIQITVIRVLKWVEGKLWSDFLPHSNSLLNSFGQQMARLDCNLKGFTHSQAERNFDWDLAQCLWVKKHLSLFNESQQAILKHFIDLFEANQSSYQKLEKQVIHNDLNDNNVLVNIDSDDMPLVSGFIDFGDAIFSQRINELAIACAYGIMSKADPLQAASHIVQGYHQITPLAETELKHLYHLIGMRLVVSVTKSTIARAEQPDNKYKTISEQPAWDLLEHWYKIIPQFAYYQFRSVCQFSPHPDARSLKKYLNNQKINLAQMFPEHPDKTDVFHVDLSVGSQLLGSAAEYEDHETQSFKIKQLQNQHPHRFLAGGYCEARSFYASDAFSIEGNNGKSYRTMHLGLDIWLPANTVIHAPLSGQIVALHNNDFKRDYGPTVILSHQYQDEKGENKTFYTLYGHLSQKSLLAHQTGDHIAAGQFLAWTGEPHENGGWSAHLHFQIIHDLLGKKHDFPGACTPNHLPVMQSICPDPKELFNYQPNQHNLIHDNQSLIEFRQQHLGKSLSLSYSEPIQMLRGDDVYLIDQYGQKYLDTCNNVAHVGHENPAVVMAGQSQMAVLNTNSRYLHPRIVEFTQSLLETLPSELSVVHLVNSGSEANELALRMAKAYSGGREVIALESGYHGNTNACIDISSYKFDGKGGQGAPEHTHIAPLPDSFRGLHRGPNCGPKYAQYVDDIIQQINNNGLQVSAFIAESIISCGGQIELPTGYLSHVYQSVRKAGGVCIADEVQVGCGRIGSHFWAFESHGVIPDILTIGKPIGNGHPLAVVVCTKEVAHRFANGMEYFNTFGGNPVSATIGLAVLNVIKKQNLQQNAHETGLFLKNSLLTLQQQYPIIKDIRGQGLFLGFELCDENFKPMAKEAAYLANRMRTLGVLISTDGPDHNVIKIKPPITFNQTHAAELIMRLDTVFQESALHL